MWGSIYWENLKGYQDNACMEKRILFRLLSGLHSSIMTQIANDYRFDGELGLCCSSAEATVVVRPFCFICFLFRRSLFWLWSSRAEMVELCRI